MSQDHQTAFSDRDRSYIPVPSEVCQISKCPTKATTRIILRRKPGQAVAPHIDVCDMHKNHLLKGAGKGVKMQDLAFLKQELRSVN